MTNQKYLIIGVLFLGLIALLILGGKKEESPVIESGLEIKQDETAKENVVPPVENTSSPTPPKEEVKTPTTPTPKTYAMTEVAKHNTKEDCWTTVSGKVYDVTSWISKHPGGAGNIIKLCGIDGTSLFTGQHGGEPRPANELAGFEIGILK